MNKKVFSNFVDAKEHILQIISKFKRKFLIIGIAGGSCSGKTTFAKYLNYPIIFMDNYYFGIEHMKNNNFDDPNAIDVQLLLNHLKQIKNGKNIKTPTYNFTTHKREKYVKFVPSNVIILEGLFSLSNQIISLIDIPIFIDSPLDICFKRRLQRDIAERGRSKEGITRQFEKYVRPSYYEFIVPTKNNAKIIINN